MPRYLTNLGFCEVIIYIFTSIAFLRVFLRI